METPDKMELITKKNATLKKWLLGSAICIVLVVAIAFMSHLPGITTVTVTDYQNHIEQKVNRELQSSSNRLKTLVEEAHVSVSVTKAYVSKCCAETKDGSNDAGNLDGKNIRKVYMEITTIWDGLIHKNGRTIIGIELEDVNGEVQLTKADFVKSDALINIYDRKFWYNVGVALGTLIF